MDAGSERVVRIRVSGRVQGVGFRFATCQQARRFSLRGWVRNRHDGSVEILAAGESTLCDRLIEWARHGPRGARVDAIEFTELAAGAAPPDSGFTQAADG